jgi:hypothetical protein
MCGAQTTYAVNGADFPGKLYCFCNLNIGHGLSPVEKSTAAIEPYNYLQK